MRRAATIATMLAAMALIVAESTTPALAQSTTSPLPSFDFRQAAAVAEWGELHDIARLEATGQGMAVHLNGPDPYFSGPPRDYPAGVPLLMKVRLRSSAGGRSPGLLFRAEAGDQRGALGSRRRQARGLAGADGVPAAARAGHAPADRSAGRSRGLPDRVDPVHAPPMQSPRRPGRSRRSRDRTRRPARPSRADRSSCGSSRTCSAGSPSPWTASSWPPGTTGR